MAEMTWDRIAPPEPCVSPDGHEWVDVVTAASFIPSRSFCPRCGEAWTIVVTGYDEPKATS